MSFKNARTIQKREKTFINKKTTTKNKRVMMALDLSPDPSNSSKQLYRQAF
jgi:hypothetical protein